MLKKVLAGTGIAAALTGMFFLGSLALGPVFAQTEPNTTPTQAVAQGPNNGSAEDNVKGPDVDKVEKQAGDQNQVDEQQPQYTGSITVNEAQYKGMSEADEAAGLQAQAKISAADAEKVALVANADTTVVKTELGNENGVLVYSVELSNGMDVKVDAGNGKVLHTEQAGNDATELAGAENTPGQ
jgi:uncharacterized membrane protein YkoI